MGKILSGILSGVSGKVAGVVGGSWKDVDYLRAYVKPANPNTAAQQTQRTKFSDCVDFVKPLVGQVFNSYTDKFQKSMSGFNFAIKRNIDEFDGSPVYSNILLTEGPLSPLATIAATYSDPTVTITFAKNLGNNGADTDAIFAAVYDTSSGIWYFASSEGTRVAESINVTTAASLTAANLECYIWAAQYVNSVLDIISNSGHDQAS